MLKKILQLVFSKVISFSVIFFEAKLSLSVCIPEFLFNLIMSVYPSTNFLTFNLVSTIQFKIVLLSNGCLQSFFSLSLSGFNLASNYDRSIFCSFLDMTIFVIFSKKS